MQKAHDLLMRADDFEKVLTGKKTFDYRLNDCGISPGDVVYLLEYEVAYSGVEMILSRRTGRKLRYEVGTVEPCPGGVWLTISITNPGLFVGVDSE